MGLAVGAALGLDVPGITGGNGGTLESPIGTPRSGLAVNAVARSLVDRGMESELVSFLQLITGSRIQAAAFLTATLANRVPLNKALSVGAWESGFNAAMKKQEPGGLFSYGVMGLLDASYPQATLEQLSDPGWNITAGVEHMARDRARARGWFAALAAYNAGTPEGRGQVSFDYLEGVAPLEARYDAMFNDRWRGER